MTEQVQNYFYFDEDTRTIFHSINLVEDRPDLQFLGSSLNPNIRMTAAVMTKSLDQNYGYTIRSLD